MRDFKRIKAWHRAHALSIALHKRTRSFPRAGYARLRAQLTAAADSIKDTIAEGCGAATNKEFARFLDMSIKSANETEGHLLTARDLDLFSLDEWRSSPPKQSRFGRWSTHIERRSSPRRTTNDLWPPTAELSSHLSPLALAAEVVLLTLFAPSLALASGLAVPGVISPATSTEPELTAEVSSLAARAFPESP
jgi:four helix bundle protein